MKSAKSYSFPRNQAISTIIREGFKRYWAIPLLTSVSVFLIIITPILLDSPASRLTDVRRAVTHQNILLLFMCCVIGISCGLLFEYLEKKSSSNFIHSLPIKRSKLFIGTLITQIIMTAIPIFLCGILLLLLSNASMAGSIVIWMLTSMILIMTVMSTTILACFQIGRAHV